MISIEIPGYKKLNLKHLVLDYNGTIACDGILLAGVKEKLNLLAGKISIYIITADTFGEAAAQCSEVNCQLKILSEANNTLEKEKFVQSLGKENVVAIGNGANDSLMIKEAALGIVVIGDEGAALKTISQADLAVKNIDDALNLLLNRQRLKATLRR
ncbi:HAD family hydrolase [Desulfofalx alkaliphila]|uniref:HAD family hydrolase n=1 Tax=Desulfofalx alkaliphila TaxID=105483 RepID=UPI0004E1B5D3|nr:HAD family hydrolase [Desulfofalx alkaliphila]